MEYLTRNKPILARHNLVYPKCLKTRERIGVSSVVLIVLAIIVSLTICQLLPLFRWFSEATTTMSLSPDEKYCISLVELMPDNPFAIDRNFKIVLTRYRDFDKRPFESQCLFNSPDEGRPVGSERFVWSKDSSYVLLVGRHFFVESDIPVVGGEQAYYLYHVSSQRHWCNSKQSKGKNETLTEESLRQIEFALPVLENRCSGPAVQDNRND